VAHPETALIEVLGKIREVTAILARRRLVEEPPEPEDVGLSRSGTFRRDEAFGPDEGLGLVGSRDEPDVGELRLTVDEDHVRRLDVAMHETMAMDVAQGTRELDAEREHFDQREAPPGFQLRGERARLVVRERDRRFAIDGVRELHDVVEVPCRVVAPDMEDVDDTGIGAGDRLELPDTGELALVRAFARKAAARDDLDRTELARRASREPDPSVAAATDVRQDLVIGHARGRRGSGGGIAQL